MNMPPRGNHTWRQCNTLSVARNFYEEDMNIFKPRIDRREDTDGVTGMQFPSYEFIVAGIYQLTGEQFWVHRCVQFLLFVLGVIGFFLLARELTDNSLLAGCAAWFYIWSPELFYHSINALPDILALSASIWGFYWFARYMNSRESLTLILSGLALILAGATKLQYLAVGGGMLVILLQQYRYISAKQWLTLIAFGMAVLAVSGGWYVYANALIRSSGLYDFRIVIKEFPQTSEALTILRSVFQVKLPEVLLGYAATTTFLMGTFVAVRKKSWKHPMALPLLGWAAVLLVYFILELGQFQHHTYYMMPFIPLLCIIAGYGAWDLMRSKQRWLVNLIIVLAPILSAARMIPGWLKEPKVPSALYNKDKRAALQQHIPKDALVIAGKDRSSGIYLYYLHAKGWAFNETTPLLETEANGHLAIENHIDRGASILVTNEPIGELRVEKYIDQLVYELDGFWIYRLRSDH